MSYVTWRKDNEEKVKGFVDDGALEKLPAWKDLANNFEICENMVPPVVADMQRNGMNLLTFSCVFAEYLFEEYHVKPLDIELFTQFIMKSSFDEMMKTHGEFVDAIKKRLFGEEL